MNFDKTGYQLRLLYFHWSHLHQTTLITEMGLCQKNQSFSRWLTEDFIFCFNNWLH